LRIGQLHARQLNPLAQLTPCRMWFNCVFGGKGVGLLNLILRADSWPSS